MENLSNISYSLGKTTTSKPDFKVDNSLIDKYLGNNRSQPQTPSNNNFNYDAITYGVKNHRNQQVDGNNHSFNQPTFTTNTTSSTNLNSFNNNFATMVQQVPIPEYNSFESCGKLTTYNSTVPPLPLQSPNNFQNTSKQPQVMSQTPQNKNYFRFPDLTKNQDSQKLLVEEKEVRDIDAEYCPEVTTAIPPKRREKEKRDEICRRYLSGKCRDSSRRCMFMHSPCEVCGGKHHTTQHYVRMAKLYC